MDKGVTAAQNVYLLLLARRFGVVVLYNLLYGLPDDDVADVEQMVSNLPRLRHLAPPSTFIRVMVTRFAPLQVDPDRFGLPIARHARAYDLIFSDRFIANSGFDLDLYCYVFEHPFDPSWRLQKAYRELGKQCSSWIRADGERDATVSIHSVSDGVEVLDSRSGVEVVHHLSSLDAAVLSSMDRPTSIVSVLKRFALDGFDVRDSIARLDQMELFFDDGTRAVSLVLPSDVKPPRHWWDNYDTRFQRSLPVISGLQASPAGPLTGD